MKIAGFIPARMASTRYPGKPLARICGITMIEHVYKRCAMSSSLNDLYIATCDSEIMRAAEGFGAKVVMTKTTHVRCTDRITEAYEKANCRADVVVLIQGDEPLVHPEMVDLAVGPLSMPQGRDIFCTNLASPITDIDDFEDPNEVKVVFDKQMRALYFSREAIPSLKKEKHQNWWKQVCVIGFWKETLEQFNRMEQTPLEVAESVDMMRILENGFRIQLVKSPFVTCSVDTPSDLQAVEAIMAKDPLFAMYR